MKISDCCGVTAYSNGDSDTEDIGICPECKEHCEYIDEEKEDLPIGGNENDCPDCNGTGTLTGTGVYPECCRNFLVNGDCCDNPTPAPYPIPIECERCEATGKIETQKEEYLESHSDQMIEIMNQSKS